MPSQDIARLDYQNRQPEVDRFLLALDELNREELIAPSVERHLTNSGREIVSEAFGDSLNIARVVGIIEGERQNRPYLSEMNAFVYEASDVVHCLGGIRCLNSEDKKREIKRREIEKVCESRKLTPQNVYLLAGIHVLRKAIDEGMVTVNPPGSPNDGCYIGYNDIIKFYRKTLQESGDKVRVLG